MISRGEFGAVGCERILRLLDREGIPATFFVTGHTADTYPDHVRASPPLATRSATTATSTRTRSPWRHPSESATSSSKVFDALDRAAGVRPTGYRSPSWDNSP